MYEYVGPAEIKESVEEDAAGTSILSADELRDWLQLQDEWSDDTVTVTFVVSPAGALRLAPRRSEHVACALGGPVLAAGELTLRSKPQLEVVGATNQSTGYCPEPSCWGAARAALKALGVPCPAELTHAYTFRLCVECGERNLVKDDWFECGCCGRELPREWNFDAAGPAGNT